MGISFLKNEKGKNTRMILSFVKQLHSHPLLLENFVFFFLELCLALNKSFQLHINTTLNSDKAHSYKVKNLIQKENYFCILEVR